VLEGTAWVLASLPGRTLVGGEPATLRFAGGDAQGSDGCNRYGAPVSVKGSSIEVSARGISTRMACPPDVTAQADAFMAALGSAKTFRVAGGRLELLAGDGSPLAVFAPQSQALAGTAWRVTGINNGKQAVVSVLGDSTVTMAFTAEGQAGGSAGCNRYTARYEADDSRLRFQAPAATRMMCANEKLMQQEQAFLKALESVSTLRREANRLELRDSGGALAISMTLDGGQ
jgi:heat shock protein HslJ